MAALWSEALNLPIEEIFPLDDFFELGGSSLTAIQLVALARAQNITITTEAILQHSQLSSLAKLSVENHHSTNIANEKPLTLSPKLEKTIMSQFPNLKFERMYPVNFAQMATLLQGQNWPEAYHVHLIVEIQGPLNVDKLREGCQKLVDHYPILRSIFHVEGETCVQLVAQAREIPISFEVFDTLKEAQNFWNKRETDFLDRPLTQFGFTRVDRNVNLLSVGLHHVQMDDWMISQVLLDLASAYLCERLRSQTSFIAYAQEVDRLDNERSAQYWRQLLKESEVTTLNDETQALCSSNDVSDQTLNRRIHRIPPLRKTTFADLLHAAWGLAMARVTRSHDIVFITVTSGRSIAFDGVENVMGPCPNVIPVRASFNAEQQYIDVLETYKRQNIASSAYETTPFTSVCMKSTDWPFPPRVGAMINHTQSRQNIFDKHPVNSLGVKWRTLPAVEQRGKCGAVHVYLLSKLEGDSVALSLQFNPTVVTEERAQQLLENLTLYLDRICHMPQDKIDLGFSF